jgi:hypothetical protein
LFNPLSRRVQRLVDRRFNRAYAAESQLLYNGVFRTLGDSVRMLVLT